MLGLTASAAGASSGPYLTITGLPHRIGRGRLLRRGLSFRESANEPVAFTDGLLGPGRGSDFDLLVARRALPLGAGTRTVTLRPRPSEIGDSRRFTLVLVLTATNAGGSYVTTTRTIEVH